MFRNLKKQWQNYKYRFIPWIAFNLEKRCQIYPKGFLDSVVPEDDLNFTLITLFEEFQKQKTTADWLELHHLNAKIVKNALGFQLVRKASEIAKGQGVFVKEGMIRKHLIVALYPGCIYDVGDAVFIQSLNNSFIFRCANGQLIDGKDTGLSHYLYRSCAFRDKIGPYFTCDISWLSESPINPLSIGQYVNNQSPSHPANVAYQEFNLIKQFPFNLRKYVPNNHFTITPETERQFHMVALISLRDIYVGEELFSSYFTLIK